jgi:hypothetical protein
MRAFSFLAIALTTIVVGSVGVKGCVLWFEPEEIKREFLVNDQRQSYIRACRVASLDVIGESSLVMPVEDRELIVNASNNCDNDNSGVLRLVQFAPRYVIFHIARGLVLIGKDDHSLVNRGSANASRRITDFVLFAKNRFVFFESNGSIIRSSVQGWSAARIIKQESDRNFYPLLVISKVREWHNEVRYPRTLVSLHSCELTIGYFGLSGQNCGLSPKNYKLEYANSGDKAGQSYLNPGGKPKIEKSFRGLPIALGWFCIFFLIWLRLAYLAHQKKSVTIAMIALLFLLSSIFGLFQVLLYENGLNANVDSALLDRRSEDIRVLAVVIPELELGDIEGEIFFHGSRDFQRNSNDPTNAVPSASNGLASPPYDPPWRW